MPRGIMVVQSAPSDPSREDEYNRWYSTEHIADVCKVPGIVAAKRYRAHGPGASRPYVAIYEIEAEDLDAPLGVLRERSMSGEIAMSDVLQMDPPPIVTFYELLE